MSVDVVYECTHLHLGQEIALDYVQIAFPLLEICFLLVAQQTVLGETRSQVDCRPVPQQLYCDLETNFDASACNQSVHTLHVRFLGAF
jgi:hypothetical protein